MNVTTIGIDLAKNSFSLHGVDSRGKLVFRKTLSRAKLLPFLGSLPPCLVGMEVCSGAHYWGRELIKLGHRVGVMAPKFVAAYRKAGGECQLEVFKDCGHIWVADPGPQTDRAHDMIHHLAKWPINQSINQSIYTPEHSKQQ